jgi:hypothetical protein
MRIFYTISCLFIFTLMNGQINSASYKLKYNKKTSLYEAYLHIEKGSSDKRADLIQYNSQMSIFTPKGSQLKIEENSLPFTTNDSGEEVISSWRVSNKIENVALVNNSTVYSINPKLSPTAYFKELKQGHTYKLFSFSVFPQPTCNDVVRLYDNINDHKNIISNYKGGNFKNAYTLGGVRQLYDNATKITNVHEISEIVLVPLKESYDEGETVEILVENKIEEYNYFLSAGKGKKVMNELIIENVKPELSGDYKITAVNDKGCKTDKDFSLNVKPLAIPEVVKPIVDKVSIYPNPVKDNLNIYLSTKETSVVSADIYDQSGRIIRRNIINEKNHKGEVTKSINLDLSSGLYHVKMTINGVQTNHPFIVIE